MTIYKASEFIKAVQSLAEGSSSPYVNMATAQRNLESAVLDGWAFGPIGDLFVQGEYEDSRKFLADNLKTGTGNFGTVLEGLNKVAKRYHAAEQANIIDPSTIKLPKVKDVDSNVETPIEGSAMLYVWKLAGAAMAMFGVTSACGKLAISAIPSSILWALFTPDDTALGTAHSRWIAAGKALESIDQHMLDKVEALNKTWSDGPAWDSFYGYMSKLRKEVAECKAAVDGGAKTLHDIHSELNWEQLGWFGSVVVSLVFLIAMEIWGDSFFVVKPLAKAAQEIAGAIVTIYVGSCVAFIAALLAKFWAEAVPLITASFVTEKKKSDEGNGVDFKEVAMSQGTLDKLVSTA